jgi:predicted lipoprotein with Yx(FWY)xxD motif
LKNLEKSKMKDEMKPSRSAKVIGLGAFLVVLALTMAACSPAAPAAVVPITGANGTAAPKTAATATVPVGMMLAGTITAGMMPGGLGGILMMSNDPKLGNFLTDAKGMTLYMYTKDTAGVSNCAGGCLASWPPLVSTSELLVGAGVTGKAGSITRADGTKQVTYNGMPLYYFAGDKAPGDITGQGQGGVWYMMSPTAPIK